MSKLTEVLKLLCYDPETDGNLTFNVTEALTKNWEKIDQLVLLAVAAAAAYDPEGSYAVGDYCTHGGGLQKCNTAIPSGEAWNAEHWTATTVAAELADVRASLSNKAASSLGQITESDLLAWADKQTLSGAFGISPSITTEGVPVVGWYHGFLEVKNGGRRITLTESAGQYRTWTNCTSSGKWTKWMQQATATPPQEVPLPLVSGVSELNVATVSKTQEGIILVNAWVGFDSPVIANTETQVAIMPENMRPKKTVGVSAIVNSGDDENLGFARISIDSGGVVRILSDISFSFAVFSIAYPAAN